MGITGNPFHVTEDERRHFCFGFGVQGSEKKWELLKGWNNQLIRSKKNPYPFFQESEV